LGPGAVGGGPNGIAFVLQDSADEVANVLFIVDDQDFEGH